MTLVRDPGRRWLCFSPVAGILFVESIEFSQSYGATDVSVPLPGFYLFKAATGIAASSPAN